MTDWDSSYYEDLQGRVRGVLIEVANQLPSLTVGLVEEMIDANESGVALETIVNMLAESGGTISTSTFGSVSSLVETMGLDENIIGRLEPLVIEVDT